MDIKTLTFFSNYFNHHQKALCDEWYSLLGEGFHFVETEPIEEFRAKMGWGKEDIPPYVIKTYSDKKNDEYALKLGLESDLVVMGTAPERFIEERLKEDKITFRYSERPLKEGFIKFFIPRLTKKYIHLHVRNRKKRIYILAASAYTSRDYNKMFKSYPGKCYKFGYFPKHIEYDPKELMDRKRKYAFDKYNDENMITILWTGRMLRLKRPDLTLKALGALAKKGYDFRLTMVGEGEEREKLLKLTKELGLEDRVSFKDFLPPDEALNIMADHKIYVMTSNFWEGWGSVVYESLNAGCACVVSHAPGAAPWLVRHEKTGLLFESGRVRSLERQLEKLFKDPSLISKYGEEAYAYMHKLWNPAVAARNVLRLYSDLSQGRDTSIKEGPCSKAEELKNNWYRDR
ncbi:MAG: glycosyltransferase family 4 protein [Lachnospiraceae bacterium]|nr:glycosyltransferase family 4 protein [Lachnospiraceae bacterium]